MIWNVGGETMSQPEREALQRERLRRSVAWAADRVPFYQLVVDRTQAFPTLAVHVEPAEGIVGEWGGFDTSRAEVAALSARVSECLRRHLGLNPEVAIVPPKTIPRSEGKAVRVVERR
ncbi:MAG: hypothetical protein ABW020_11950 [Candidatus Rokuibacteriota bacterium]